jgi:Glycosyl hydrolase family 26
MAPNLRGRTMTSARDIPTRMVARSQRRRAAARFLVAMLAAACAVGVTPLAASAASTPTPTAVTTGPATVTLAIFDTDIVLVGGRGFAASAAISLDALAGELGGTATVNADAQGRFVLGFEVPGGFAGNVSVTATGGGNKKASGTLGITVPADDEPTTASTPTGSPTTAPAPAPTTAPTTAAKPPASGLSGSLASLTGSLSGLPWASGVYNQSVLASMLAFGSWRGRPIDVALLYTTRSSWDGLIKPDWPVNLFSAFAGRLVLSQPAFPQGQGNNAACAAGQYNDKWKQFGSYLVAHNRADSVVRLDWEFNGTFMYWHSDGDPTSFKNCFRQVAQSIKSTDPKVLIDWTINAHGSPVPSSGNPFDAYPGDDVVDIVGIDDYDHYPPSKDEATWDKQCNDVNGLCYFIKFARAHGKKVSVGEWGVTSCSGNGGGDNPFYIQKMYDTFKANADVIAYESYFNDAQPGNVCTSIVNGGQNPKSSALYKSLFGAA